MSVEKYSELNKIFNSFHDGYFESEFRRNKNDFLLKISIKYLAELIKSDYKYFFIKLLNLKKIELVIYKGDAKERINNIEEILNLKPDIFSCDYNESRLIIKSNINNFNNNKNCYAELFLSCDNYKLYDQRLNEIDYRNIIEISEFYWKNK